MPSGTPGGLKEFLAWAKDREITFGSAGVGSGSHLAAEYFFRVHAKVKALHVPFRGGGPAIQALLGNQIDLVASSFGVTSQINDGKLKGLAVASPERNPAMPQVPTYKEIGFPLRGGVLGRLLRAGGDGSGRVAKLNAAINEVMSEKAGLEHLTKLGFQVSPRTVAESQAYLKARPKSGARWCVPSASTSTDARGYRWESRVSATTRRSTPRMSAASPEPKASSNSFCASRHLACAALQPSLARRRELEFAHARVVPGCDRQQLVALERTDRAAERGAIHHHRLREFVDGERTEPVQLGEDRVLRGPQALRGEVAVVDLADMACGLP